MEVNIELSEFYVEHIVRLLKKIQPAADSVGFRVNDGLYKNLDNPRNIRALAASLDVFEAFLTGFEKFAKKSGDPEWLPIVKDPHYKHMLDATKVLAKATATLEKMQKDLDKLPV